MEKRNTWIRFALRIASYILVAALASLATFFAFGESKLAELERVIHHRFIGQVDTTAIEDAAANAMVNALGDRWSYYISAEEYQAYEERKTNSYVGIGITIMKREDGTGFDILSVEEGGSAQKAGVLPGDILIEAEGQSVAGMDSDGPAEIIKGKAGTKVEIAVLRDGERLEFRLTRQTIETVITTGELLENGIGYVKIRNFNDHCAERTLQIVKELQEEGAQAFIFDVRNNPGGYVVEMNEILDYLLPEGDLFRSVRSNGEETVDTSDAACLELPMAVLVNGDSYSAAEFFAAALQEYEWAVVVGEPTSGKGYFQNTFRFSDGSAVGLSVGQYFTPKGVSLAEVGGLTPDVVLEVDMQTAAEIYSGVLLPEDDPQIQAAITALEK